MYDGILVKTTPVFMSEVTDTRMHETMHFTNLLKAVKCRKVSFETFQEHSLHASANNRLNAWCQEYLTHNMFIDYNVELEAFCIQVNFYQKTDAVETFSKVNAFIEKLFSVNEKVIFVKESFNGSEINKAEITFNTSQKAVLTISAETMEVFESDFETVWINFNAFNN